jgi:hypothetical protein
LGKKFGSGFNNSSFCTKATISELKKNPSTKLMPEESHHNLVRVCSLLFFVISSMPLKVQSLTHTNCHSKEGKNVSGSTAQWLQWPRAYPLPTNMVSIKILRDMNKIPTEAGPLV